MTSNQKLQLWIKYAHNQNENNPEHILYKYRELQKNASKYEFLREKAYFLRERKVKWENTKLKLDFDKMLGHNLDNNSVIYKMVITIKYTDLNKKKIGDIIDEKLEEWFSNKKINYSLIKYLFGQFKLDKEEENHILNLDEPNLIIKRDLKLVDSLSKTDPLYFLIMDEKLEINLAINTDIHKIIGDKTIYTDKDIEKITINDIVENMQKYEFLILENIVEVTQDKDHKSIWWIKPKKGNKYKLSGQIKISFFKKPIGEINNIIPDYPDKGQDVEFGHNPQTITLKRNEINWLPIVISLSIVFACLLIFLVLIIIRKRQKNE